MKNNNGSYKILIIDHQPKWIALIRQILTFEGYHVVVANQGEKAIQLTTNELPDMVLIEPFLPGSMDGFEIARHIRQFSNMAIIVLSSHFDQEDILKAFNAGADDFIAKPFNSRILIARIKAVLNRCHEKPVLPEKIKCNDLVINLAAHKVTIDNIEVILTETEYKLLLELAKNRDKVLLHEQLLAAVWGPEYTNEVMYLRSYIHTLRRKLEKDPSNPRLIKNRSGIGYILVSETSMTKGN